MKFYSGFCFFNEKELFEDILNDSDFLVAGFSKGAIEAFEYVKNSKIRVDKLILISPAFFQDRDEKFKKLQLIFFKKDPKKYLKNFYENVAYPSNIDIKKYQKEGSAEEIEKLLNYNWNEKELQKVIEKGVEIEVYLGEKDKIINSLNVYDFFKRFSTIYYIKKVGHLLRGRES